MPIKVSDETLRAAVDAVADAGGNVAVAARAMGIPRATLLSRLDAAKLRGIGAEPAKPSASSVAMLQAELKRLRADNQGLRNDALTAETIKAKIVSLVNDSVKLTPPPWVLESKKGHKGPGVPTLFLSDLHWGERVRAEQINGVNSYDLATAKRRLRTLGDSATRLLRILSPEMDYPGLVLLLGGDMVSGNIHEELSATNELNTIPTVLDLFSELVGFIGGLANTFGRLFIPCVTGNHGRDTRKIWSKDRQHTSFDWLLYQILAKHFEHDKRVQFLIPDGSDAYFKVFSHRYVLTHGDQFRGGDGMIGALGPIIRGDHKKRSRNAQVDMEYDTMLCGHWHQYLHLTRLIVNGSLKGYDEYAYTNNFPYEKPQQALWLTHAKYGITYRMPVYVDDKGPTAKTNWVSLPK